MGKHWAGWIDPYSDVTGPSDSILIAIACTTRSYHFPLSLLERRIDARELTSDSSVIVTYTGLPFEAIKITDNITSEEGLEWYGAKERSKYSGRGNTVFNDPHNQRAFTVTRTSEYLWNGIILNTILFIVFSIILVKLSTWIRDEIEYRGYYKT